VAKKCVFYGCTNDTGEVTIKWICIGENDNVPANPPSKCTVWFTQIVNSCKDCGDIVGQLNGNNSGKQGD
jgi:hypothetical protein